MERNNADTFIENYRQILIFYASASSDLLSSLALAMGLLLIPSITKAFWEAYFGHFSNAHSEFDFESLITIGSLSVVKGGQLR